MFFYPSPQQIEFAHKLVDADSTIILGHHPHVIQGIERYKHGLIAYSLGNFQFDPYVSNSPNNQSFILTIELTKNELESYNINPVKIDRDFVPYLVSGEEKTGILEFISKISDPIVKKQLNENKWFEEISEEYLYGNIKSWVIRIKKYGIKHFLQFIRWLISPFCLRCYAAVIRRKFKKLVEKV
ncbi:MAG TPA: hypothetical protein DEG96_09915 [Candidatus Atribacteria bacterium]|uniref:Poly-gamma-glutamate biosynthesis protein n=1 Tax=candidate division TA06 bacterium 34_109 TaxID=1635277 RepID=A0A101I0G0_UNCT6|nr:MAG: Poly-gamma-glutamate biosynthesis protein [candidate division TA06 bacterium 34_109]HBY58149.1 hypothetical protein [Candidatus Atribacteria bacterium]